MQTTPKVLNRYKMTAGETGLDISRNSRWGNPYKAFTKDMRDEVCDKFELYIAAAPKEFILDAIRELKGSNLICTCSPKRCHGDTLLRVVNDPSYIADHYPTIEQLKRVRTVTDQSQLISDLTTLTGHNPKIIESYGLTPAKIIKDKKLLEFTKFQYILKRYCTQLAIFNTALEAYESGSSIYYHQYYFTRCIAPIASMDEYRFMYKDLLEIHLATLLFFNTLAVMATIEKSHELVSKRTLLDKYVRHDFNVLKTELIHNDEIVMPGTDTTITAFLKQYSTILEL